MNKMLESAMEVALRYGTIKQFRADHPSAYSYIHKKGASDQAFSHMRRIRVLQHEYDDGRHCTVCKSHKPITEFHAVRSGSTQRRSYCKACSNQKSAAWRADNTESARASCRASAKRNPETSRRAKRLMRLRHPEACAARDMMKRVLQLTGQRRSTRTEPALGYSRQELREHLEMQFVDGMTWDNWGEWHIDHIKPVMEYLLEGEADPAVINALSNLRPLWGAENLARQRSRRSY